MRRLAEVDLLLASGQHSQVVGPLGPTSCDVVRLGWLTGGGCRSEQAQLVLSSRECRFKMVAEAADLAADALQIVTEVVQFRIAQARLLQIALQVAKAPVASLRSVFWMSTPTLLLARATISAVLSEGAGGCAGCAVACAPEGEPACVPSGPGGVGACAVCA